MIFKLYAIKDKKSDFLAPVPLRDHDQAKRWFDNEVKTNPFMKEYREDFEIYNLGTFDAETGVIERVEFPEFIMSAEEVNVYGNREETI